MWASKEQPSPASDYLELDMGSSMVLNLLEFDILKQPFSIEVDYDTAGEDTVRKFAPAFRWREYENVFPTRIVYEGPDAPPWYHFKMLFKTAKQTNVTTRFIRIIFSRDPITNFVDTSPFFDPNTKQPIPYSATVKNLKIGRVGQPFSADLPSPRIDPLTGQVISD